MSHTDEKILDHETLFRQPEYISLFEKKKAFETVQTGIKTVGNDTQARIAYGGGGCFVEPSAPSAGAPHRLIKVVKWMQTYIWRSSNIRDAGREHLPRHSLES